MFKQFLKSDEIFLIPLCAVAVIWQYYIGYIFASIFLLFLIYFLFTLISGSETPQNNGLITVVGVAGLPILFGVGLSVWANEFEIGRIIEISVLILICLSIIVESLQSIKKDIERKKEWKNGAAQKRIKEFFNVESKSESEQKRINKILNDMNDEFDSA